MEQVVRVRIRVSGRVQGVWYRASAREQALALGCSGWVRNLVDGSVQLEAEGGSLAIDRLTEWCRRGPELARVDHVEIERIEPQRKPGSFEVRR